MVTREFMFRGKTLPELKKLDIKEFAQLVPSRQRRSLLRGALEKNKPLIQKIRKANAGTFKKNIKTHARDMVVLPEMVGLTLHIYNGKEFKPIKIEEDMLGSFFGELSLTRSKVQHSAPGIGATKSSTAIASKAK